MLDRSPSGQHKWVCQPWFYEGEDYPESSGTPTLIEAPTREAAFEEARAVFEAELTSLSDIHTMTPEEWFAQGGYPFEGLDRP